VTTALQIFDNDTGQVLRSLGDTDVTNAALASVLAGQMHFGEAYGAWLKLADNDKSAKFKKLGEDLIEKFAAARKFQLAAHVATGVRTSEAEKPVIGQISNGGFEIGVKIKNANLFEWLIAEGAQPQIALSETETHGGKLSLWMIFDTFETALTAAPITSTPATVPAPDWTPLRVKFTVPSDSDGIIIRLVREGCSGPSCPINGSLAFDDISLRRLENR
jgi:hypothetical protein